ncbi:MAG: bifunctional ADP-dependent NAD(P)H-hydrate dehydratase/NAD(P)H-hydrate epimerase [Sulfobacillus benefaciens]|uniref:Bifunctional NAD(P)H-hydrate repair enzyme n=1 Tax=Sulfobacillus benefaciens TaxID=453960 RepID=A0A2T2XER4_9FIRM|nr:MAG: bifunctional ADP-dependent NAD(P)H-hydrate dehydratase/NAD(P)H-hydrate epimerase [Sulfobacillus benefaciens]
MTTQIWTKDQTKAQDGHAMANGVPFLSLMEVAGSKVAQYIRTRLKFEQRQIEVLAGKGANGGDGLVVARYLAPYYDVTVRLVDGVPRFDGAEAMLRAAQSLGAQVKTGWPADLAADLLVDGVFGTGFHGSVNNTPLADIYESINRRQIPVVAIDLLSGVAADSGDYHGPSINALATITFGASKWGHWGYPGASMRGELVVADIGLGVIGESTDCWLDARTAKEWLPSLSQLGHKYQRGRVVVVGGSKNMAGAPLLSAMAALRTGAGLVTLIVPQGVADRIAAPPTILVHEGPGSHGSLHWSDEETRLAAAADVIVVGPGLGQGVAPAVLEALLGLGKPTVIDADGLRLLKQYSRGTGTSAPMILTPHSGEAARLLDLQDVDQDRPKAARQLMDRYQATVILKGAYSIIGDMGKLTVNPTGTPEMATPGSGDVLAGMVGSLLAQGLDPGAAAALAAYWHGWAGMVAKNRYGQSVVATDLIDGIAKARRWVEDQACPSSAPTSM